jgi:outer membrane protein OmpA-like peptidoglycan-associated protein
LIQTVVSLSGEVYDATTKSPISVNVEIFGEDGKRINKVKSNSKDGSYFFTGLKPGASYEIRVAEFDYMRQSFSVSLPATKKYAEFSKDITLTPKKAGMKMKLPIKAFEIGKSKLKFGVEIFLNDFVAVFKANPTVKFRVICYPDLDGDAAKNMELTKARSASIKDYFISMGISGERISVDGAGSIDPTSPPPSGKASKGKRYIGPSYFVIESF